MEQVLQGFVFSKGKLWVQPTAPAPDVVPGSYLHQNPYAGSRGRLWIKWKVEPMEILKSIAPDPW